MREQPNIVCIMSDTFLACHPACYADGDTDIPNLDGFAREAPVFDLEKNPACMVNCVERFPGPARKAWEGDAMKRSEINRLIEETIAFAGSHGFLLPPFAFWSPEEWKKKGPEADEIRDCMLGWDLTDFGSGDFHRAGLILFTIRNGRLGDSRYPKPYAEKMLVVGEKQDTPMHFHWHKSEDIIVRGGGNLIVQLYNSTRDEQLAATDVTVSLDGTARMVKAGGTVTLTPGESIFLPSRLYHKFWGEKGKGKVLLGEVSMVNDDTKDNRFHEPVGRFPEIEEDEPPRHLLFSEYPGRGQRGV